MQNSELQLFQKVGIAQTGNYNYSEIANSFLSDGYTSSAGNTYFNSIWFVDGLAILADIGQGHTWTFLNGLKIINIKDKQLIYDEHFHCYRYNKMSMMLTITNQVSRIIVDSAFKQGLKIDPQEVFNKVQNFIREGFMKDQRYMLNYNSKKFLTA